MGDSVVTAIAFAALGANVLATGLLLLLNPGSRSVRWYVVFLSAISVWLLVLGTTSITGDRSGVWATAFAVPITLMPLLFLASAVGVDDALPRQAPWLVTVIGLALLPFAVIAFQQHSAGASVATLAWQTAGWVGGSIAHWQAQERRSFRNPRDRRAHRLVLGIVLLATLAVVGGYLMDAQWFFRYVMPSGIIAIHFVVFIGVARLRFYDIDVRVARSGEIAGRAGEVERLAAVGELAASIAHEVRNPLTGIRSLAQRMADEQLDKERGRRYAATIVEEAERMDRIVAGLLTLARRGRLGDWSGEPTRLDTLFDDLVLLVSARATRAGISVRTDTPAIVAPAPREALAQSLLNLLLNAITHTPRGGTVVLSARESPVGDGITISVRDTGPGVPATERERIFAPFYTASVDGTGLGLSVVRRLARELDWTLELDDAPGGGAEFRIVLPQRDARTARAVATT